MKLRTMEKSKEHVPIRMCLSCRTKRGKQELIRLTLDSYGQLVVDENKMKKGRGAYVCPDKSCWEILNDGNRLRRAFKREDMINFHVESPL